jgi:hypothetical protein
MSMRSYARAIARSRGIPWRTRRITVICTDGVIRFSPGPMYAIRLPVRWPPDHDHSRGGNRRRLKEMRAITAQSPLSPPEGGGEGIEMSSGGERGNK